MIYFLLVFVILPDQLAASQPEAFTQYGKLLGAAVRPENSEITCRAFLGVPFAQPPIGKLRFKKTEAPNPWTDVLNATETPPRCLQFPSEYVLPGPAGKPDSEDCLYLNIVLPEKPTDQKTHSVISQLAVPVKINKGKQV